MRWFPDLQSKDLPNRLWICRVWRFLEEFAKEKRRDLKKENLKNMSEERLEENLRDLSEKETTDFIRGIFAPLSKWCILPATEGNQVERSKASRISTTERDQKPAAHFLVPLNVSESVLDFSDCGESNRTLIEALRCLGLPELNSVVLSTVLLSETCYITLDSYNLARNLVATLKTPHSLLMALNRKLKTNSPSLDGILECKQAMEVLDYFSRNIKAVAPNDTETLKKLPFFPLAGSRLGNVQNKDVFVLPSKIPEDELDAVESKLNCLFVQSRQTLSNLYQFLEFHDVSPSEVYLNFILKCFQYLSFEGKLAHLRYLRGFVFSVSERQTDCEEIAKIQLLDHLKRVEFIPAVDGSSKTACSFYDPRNEVFCAMLSEDSFPSKPFNSDEWLPFLEKIGLIKDVSGDNFLKFANQVASEAEIQRTKKTYKKSEVLMQHLFSRPNVVGEGLLHLVSKIPFVAADPVEESLQEVCVPYGVPQGTILPFIAFKDSVVHEYEEIVWTEAHLLPRSADPRCHLFKLSSGCPHGNVQQYLRAFLAQLYVQTKPSVELVISHFQTLRARGNITADQCSTVTRVMESIYAFLQDNALKNRDAQIQLQTSRFILVEGGKRFVLPRQVVIELYERLEIKPFLYRIPPVFGKFQTLFDFVGCSKTVTCKHYGMVLEMMHRNCKNSKLNPNELKMCSKAIKGFFSCLQDDKEAVSTLSKLYLPAMPSQFCLSNERLGTIPVTLHQSTELLFDDAPDYGNRIKGLEQLFVLELSLMGVSRRSGMVNFTDLMLKLPSAVQPRMLSVVVKEKIADPEHTVAVSSSVVNIMKQRISSVPFVRGVARIIRHVNHQDKDFDETVITGIEKDLKNITLFPVEGLRTSLFFNEVQISGSEADVPYFADKPESPGVGICRVYINTISGIDESISIISDIIVDMYAAFLGRKANVIPEMLRCQPSKIWALLDRKKIRKDDSCTTADLDIYPEPGALIPIEDHHRLNNAFEEFEPGEYVGYLLDDPSLDQRKGTPTYIYAIIEKAINSDDTVTLTKAYLINIGLDKEPVVVSSTNLHKFHRLKEIFEGLDLDEEEVLKEISDILENAWKMQEDERVKIVKRLFMRWFPSGDISGKQLFLFAFQHLKKEVSRLGGRYEELFDSWKAQAMEHGSQRETYQERYRSNYGPWSPSSYHSSRQNVPPSFCKKNAQPGEAKRWLRQAKADLESCAREISFNTDSFEWVCFKCHQAAEKALKAVQYSTDANQKINDHNLLQNCSGFDDPVLPDFARQLECLLINSAHMRYPDTMSYPRIPHDVYTEAQATEAFSIATKILERVQVKLN